MRLPARDLEAQHAAAILTPEGHQLGAGIEHGHRQRQQPRGPRRRQRPVQNGLGLRQAQPARDGDEKVTA